MPLGRSQVYKTIPPITDSGPRLNYSIVAAPPIELTNDADDDNHNDSDDIDTDFEPGYADEFDPGDDHGLDGHFEDDSMLPLWIIDWVGNPISTFIAGFSTCAAMWLGTWIVQRRRRSRDMRREVKYAKLESDEQEVFFDEEQEKEFKDDVELRGQAAPT